MPRGLKVFEKNETAALLRFAEDMNRAHAAMGGRDSRWERKALMQCMRILHRAIKNEHHRRVAERKNAAQEAPAPEGDDSVIAASAAPTTREMMP